jgi:hypothetical protein
VFGCARRGYPGRRPEPFWPAKQIEPRHGDDERVHGKEAAMALECLTVIVLLGILFSMLLFPIIGFLLVLPAGVVVLAIGAVVEDKNRR